MPGATGSAKAELSSAGPAPAPAPSAAGAGGGTYCHRSSRLTALLSDGAGAPLQTLALQGGTRFYRQLCEQRRASTKQPVPGGTLRTL